MPQIRRVPDVPEYVPSAKAAADGRLRTAEEPLIDRSRAAVEQHPHNASDTLKEPSLPPGNIVQIQDQKKDWAAEAQRLSTSLDFALACCRLEVL